MDRDEALKLLRGGDDGVAEWNRRRNEGEAIPELNGADLRDVDLTMAELYNVNLIGAQLTKAVLSGARLIDAKLRNADLSGAYLIGTDLRWADLSGADFTGAFLGGTTFDEQDLSEVRGLAAVLFAGRCTVGTGVLAQSGGRIPDSLLRGCGLQSWEVTHAKLHDPDLTSLQIADLQAEAFRQRTHGPIFIGGVFISYSHDDSGFVDNMRAKLIEKGVSVWLDRHDLVAGPLRRQVVDAIRLNDIVLLVLSEHSVHSNWVDYELQKALQKEADEGRQVLCPVALDAAWHARTKEGGHWSEVREKTVLDFSKWKTKDFGPQFDKLLKGLKIYYEPPKNAAD